MPFLKSFVEQEYARTCAGNPAADAAGMDDRLPAARRPSRHFFDFFRPTGWVARQSGWPRRATSRSITSRSW